MFRFIPLVILFLADFVFAQPGDIVPGPNLVVEGVPKISAALAEKVGRYTEFRSAGLVDWHPSRHEMLIATRFGDTTQIHEVERPGGARTQLTFFADSVGGAVYPPHTGDYFLFSKGAGGNERFQIYRYERADGKVTLLTDGKSRNGGPRFSNKGDRIVYSSTRRTGADADFYVMDPSDPKSAKLILENKGGGWAPLDWSLDDQRILFGEYVSINESHIWELDLGSGGKTRLNTPGKEAVAFAAARYAKNGKGLYVITDQDSEFKRLAHWELGNNKFTFLTKHIKWDVESFAQSRNGAYIAFIINEDGIDKLQIHANSHETSLEIPLPPGLIGNIQWHNDSKMLGFNLVSARSPADVYSFNTETGKVERWTHSETGGLVTTDFVEPELIRWKSFDDRSISGFLYQPPPKFMGKRPVIIDIHGGPESQFQPTFLARRNYYLNELGIVLLFPNIRGSSGYGKTFLTLDNGYKREDTYKDIGALLDWIAKRPDLDAERIMVIGGSYGGHMTLAVATYYPDRIRCAVDIVGVSNLVTLLENTEPYRRDLRRAEYGDERDKKMRTFLTKIAPVNNADKIQKPLFVIQGKNDPRVPASEAEQMVAAIRKHGTPVWYLMAKDEGHGFAKKKNADFQFYATLMFIDKFLLDGLDSARLKPAAITPTSAYKVEKIHGFKVLVHPEVLAHETDYRAAAKELAGQLERIEKAIPPDAFKALREVPFWMEWQKKPRNAAEYHVSPGWLKDNGYNTDKAGGVEIANVQLFLRSSSREQPWMMLHELAHAYHFRVLGVDHTGVKAAYKQAIERKLYDQVKYHNGKTVKAYAATNEREYFAELSEAYFGKNDFYPFNRDELRRHDPEGYKLMESAWGKKE